MQNDPYTNMVSPEMKGYYAMAVAILKGWTATESVKWIFDGKWPTTRVDLDIDEVIEFKEEGLSYEEISREMGIPARIIKYKVKTKG